jgi:hypothetical protein
MRDEDTAKGQDRHSSTQQAKVGENKLRRSLLVPVAFPCSTSDDPRGKLDEHQQTLTRLWRGTKPAAQQLLNHTEAI